MFSKVSDLFRWFKEHFRDPIPGQSTPGTPHGGMTARTPYNGTPGINGKFHNVVFERSEWLFSHTETILSII